MGRFQERIDELAAENAQLRADVERLEAERSVHVRRIDELTAARKRLLDASDAAFERAVAVVDRLQELAQHAHPYRGGRPIPPFAVEPREPQPREGYVLPSCCDWDVVIKEIPIPYGGGVDDES